MACQCKNEDGTLSQSCRGVCSINSSIIQTEDNKRDPLNGLTELILSQVGKMIDIKLSKFHLEIHDEFLCDYKTAFKEGIREGIKIERNIDDYE
jgi:hypothetical protein